MGTESLGVKDVCPSSLIAFAEIGDEVTLSMKIEQVSNVLILDPSVKN